MTRRLVRDMVSASPYRQPSASSKPAGFPAQRTRMVVGEDHGYLLGVTFVGPAWKS